MCVCGEKGGGGGINFKFYTILFFYLKKKYLYTYISCVGLHLSTRLFLLPCHAGSRGLLGQGVCQPAFASGNFILSCSG